MAMPKASMDKYRNSMAWQDDVRFAGESKVVETKPKAGSVQIVPHHNFWRGVRLTDRCHHFRSRLRFDNINHLSRRSSQP
jgi:hypothetical protein